MIRSAAEPHPSLAECLRSRAATQPGQTAYVFLSEGAGARLDYATLDRRARAVAAVLRESVPEGGRALLSYPPGLDFIAAFFGCLYAGVVAVPAYPPRGTRSDPRLAAIAEDARPSAVLTVARQLSSREHLAPDSLLDQANWIATDRLADAAAPLATASPADLAFLQYTSGSTAGPKGVMVSHANLCHNLEDLDRGWAHGPDSVMVTWLPAFHDMGLVYGLLLPLYKGFPCYLMAPAAFLARPLSWLEALSRYRATHSAAPNFAYALCVDRTTEEARAELDLSAWRMALNAAEPVRAETLERFARAFAPAGFSPRAFCPGYGLAESTLKVTAVPADTPYTALAVQGEALTEGRILPAGPGDAVRMLVGCGSGQADTEILIVDPETLSPCTKDRIGEIWVAAGPSLAKGYWQRPEATRETFEAHTATGAGPFLRTGDLGFLHRGELFVTGRLKDLIIIRGLNFYPQDLELSAQGAHPALKPDGGAACSVDIDGEERLVLVQEISRSHCKRLDAQAVMAAVRRRVAEDFQLQPYAIALLKPATLPKTSSGKIQHHACREAFLNGTLDTLAEWRADSPGPPPASRDRADELIRWLRGYAGERINSRLIDERRCIPPYVVLDFGNRGLLGLQAPARYGGLDLAPSDSLRVLEQLGAIDLTLFAFVGVHNLLGVRPILNWATESLREECLPLLARGRALAAFALTEPGAGSHPQALAAQGLAAGGGWRLYGQKLWSGSASWASFINVFVQQLDEQGQPLGISGFVLRQGVPGLRQGPEALTLGMRGMVQNQVILDGVWVDADQRLGRPGQGLEVAQDAMLAGRLAIAAASLGAMKRSLQLMLRYAGRRHIATGRLLDHPLTRARLGEHTAAVSALEALVYRITARLDQGHPVPAEAYAACKIAGPELLWAAVDHLVQLLGGRGYIETNHVPQLLRDARLLRIFEGPTEALLQFLGSRALNQGAELSRLLAEALGAPQAQAALSTALGQIDTAKLDSKACSYNLAGEMAVRALLWGAVEGAAGAAAVQDWARRRFEEAAAAVRKEHSPPHVATLAERIEEYAASIGDLEQTLSGEDGTLDELLRKESGALQSVPALATGVEGSDLSATDRAAIASWIGEWLRRRLHLERIDPLRALAEYGLDSVVAVELAMALGEWLGRPLEDTLVWNFPNIDSLAGHLARGQGSPAADLDELSAEDLAELLAAELRG